MTRKIIQIASTDIPKSMASFQMISIIALCNDGTLWRTDDIDNGGFNSWDEIRDIPQDESSA